MYTKFKRDYDAMAYVAARILGFGDQAIADAFGLEPSSVAPSIAKFASDWSEMIGDPTWFGPFLEWTCHCIIRDVQSRLVTGDGAERPTEVAFAAQAWLDRRRGHLRDVDRAVDVADSILRNDDD